ncbi:MAG TPA: PaaI family thioesterase [Polaromonas sp.]|uniref:PaaI family thioesterase n=1 Tax=Polaromonas sp. TaxID=1869339 RepID=UPI002D3D4349|nr:PaaI family thioesterase [Polaromonas sp.]HYW56751.1 PaaI family thioesterase [Polaromonas sp.]
MSIYNPERNTAFYNKLGEGHLPGLMGIKVLALEQGSLRAELKVRKDLFAPNGFLHAGTVVTLADTACGYGCSAHLPAGAKGFTTIELKSNHLGTALDGVIEVEARAVHLGRTTHVWDATVRRQDTGKTIALFRCTQMIL